MYKFCKYIDELKMTTTRCVEYTCSLAFEARTYDKTNTSTNSIRTLNINIYSTLNSFSLSLSYSHSLSPFIALSHSLILE